MNCFVHDRSPAIGICGVCQKAVCRTCVANETPRLVCRTCLDRRVVLGYEYQSPVRIGNVPLLHVCLGLNPVTMRPKVARGVVAIGNIAVGAVAIGGLACGLVTVAGCSLGLIAALGGAAIGLGLSIGGLAVGSIALGGAAVGFVYAIGGAGFGQAIIDAQRCDQAALDFVRRWIGSGVVPPNCR